MCQIRKRTEPEDIAYSLYLYFLGLSLRNISKALSRFVKRSHTAIRDWIQKYKPWMLSSRKIRITDVHGLYTNKDTIFVGRKEELHRLFNEIDKPKSITVIVGEEGIGKSTLIQEFCKRLKNTNNPPFIGIYDNNSVIENDSQSLIFPFIEVLEALLNEIQNTTRAEEKINITKNRLRNALEKFAKQKGKEITGAVITDIA